MERFVVDPGGAFSLSESAAFWQGVTPGRGTAESDGDRLVLGFRQDGDFAPVAVSLAQMEDRSIEGRVASGDRDVVSKQVARMLALDADPAPWEAVLARDEVMARLQARWPGFRPVCFPSPWEAAAWGVIVQGIGMQRASRIKAALAAAHGDRVEIDGRTRDVFPSPRAVLDRSIGELDPERLRRLRAVAELAERGDLEADRLRSMDPTDALAMLRAIRGVGDWTARHVLYRGAALADGDPFGEPRVRRGIALAYELGETPDEERCAEIAEGWCPYRMWGAILVVRALAGTPGWHGPEKRGGRTRR